jgi:hypothetical protein
MSRLRTFSAVSVLLAALSILPAVATRPVEAGDWLGLYDHPPAGGNMIVLINSDALRQGAAKLKQFKDDEQKTAAANLLAEIPENSRRVVISALVDFATLQPVWQTTTATFQKGKLPTPDGIVAQEGGYVDQLGGMTVAWSPRGRYVIPQGTDRLTIYKPADRTAAARWIRSLSKPAEPLADYLKQATERSQDGAALVLAIDMTDGISPVSLRPKLATLQALASAKGNLDELVRLVADLRGVTFTVSVESPFAGQLQFDFDSAAAPLAKLGKEMAVEIFSRRGILLPELPDWKTAVEGNSLVLTGSLDTGSVIDLLSFLTSAPSTDDAAYQSASSAEAPPSTATAAGNSQAAQASKKYFTAVQRILSECRNTRGLSVGQRGMFNDRLSRKIDRLPIMYVDQDLVDYGTRVAELIRGAGHAIRTAKVEAAGQKSPGPTWTMDDDLWFGPSFQFNDNAEYNESLARQARADGMQRHIANMKQVDNLTAEVRRTLVEKYKIEF